MKTIDEIVNDCAKVRNERDLWRQTAFRLGGMLGHYYGDDPMRVVVETYEAVESGCVCNVPDSGGCPEHDDPTKD